MVNKIDNIVKILKIVIPLVILILYFIISKYLNNKKLKLNRNKNIGLRKYFIVGTIKTTFIFICIILFLSNFSFFVSFKDSFLMSSSLIIVILGFIFQQGLSNIVHGIIIFISKPFEIGDRIQITCDGDIISGYVQSINLRHTSILTIIDNAICIVPNYKIDNSVIKNLTNEQIENKYPIIIPISYEDASNRSQREIAKDIMKNAIFKNKYTICKNNDINNIFIKIDYDSSSVNMTSFICTNTIEENIIACSEIKETILDEFRKNNITIPFNTITIDNLNRNKN